MNAPARPAPIVSKTRSQAMVAGCLGIVLGYSLSRIGFTRYSEVFAMFTLKDPRLFLVFGSGVGLSGLGFYLIRRRVQLEKRHMHPGLVPGAMIFGFGWALSGACPGVIFAQIGEGYGLAVYSLAGAVCGSTLYRYAHRRLFKWDRGTCS